MELWRWPERGLASRGAVVFPHLQNPSCVFSVGEEEEGRARGRGGCAAPRTGLGHSRAWDTPRVMSPALWHQNPALLEVLCTPRSWCVPWEGSVHPKISVNPLRVLLVHPELSGHPPGGFSAPQDFGASPQGVPVHPKVLVPPRGRFCAPQDLGAPPGWFLCPPALGALPGGPPVTVHFIYGVTYVILSIFLTFPEKR